MPIDVAQLPPRSPTDASLKFSVRSALDVMNDPPLEWVAHEVISVGAVGVLYGEPGTAKTQAALHLCLSLVRGIPWFGCATKQGGVVYVALEGRLGDRLKAFAEYDEIADEDLQNFYVMRDSADLRSNDAAELARCIQAKGIPDLQLIVVDTLNRAMPGGNENAVEDMSEMIAAGSLLVETTGAAVMFIHHVSKGSGKAPRGHSSLTGAVDFELRIDRNGDVRHVFVAKERDANDQYTLGAFKLATVGNSIALDPLSKEDAAKRTDKAVKLSDHERDTLSALHEGLSNRELVRVANASQRASGARQGQTSLKLDDWREILYARWGSDVDAETKRKRFLRARGGLVSKQFVQICDDYVWLFTAKWQGRDTGTGHRSAADETTTEGRSHDR
jgi:hypothetical protein